MHIGILTTESEPEADIRLCEAAGERGHEPVLLNVMKCAFSVCEDDGHLFYNGVPIEEQIDVILPRVDIPHTEFGLSVLRQFLALNIPATDQPSAIEAGRNKLQCLQRLMHEHVPMPVTGFAYTRDDFDRILSEIGDAPVVVKLLEGTEGNGVFLAHSDKEAKRIFDKYNKTSMHTILQEFVADCAGTDVRSFVVGGRIVANMRRVSQTGDFRANVSLGAHSYATDLSAEEEAVVMAAVKAIGINIGGVDFVRSGRGPLVLEINTSPGFTGVQGIESVTGVDVAGAMIEYAAECALTNNSWHGIAPMPTPMQLAS